jgi:endogenous inhibitor of DNA gyrase (YacG/DUF329 family)
LPEPTPEKKPYNCRRCQRRVAETDGVSIFFGPKPVPLNPTQIMFTCPFCHAEVRWQTTRDRNGLLKNGNL